MAYKSKAKVTPLAQLILNYLAAHPGPQPVTGIADDLRYSYFSIRNLCKSMAENGTLVKSIQGRSPFFALATAEPEVTDGRL